MVDTAGGKSLRLGDREELIRMIALLALAAGGVYLIWRLLWTWHGSNPVMFFVLFMCEVFGWLMLATFTYLAWQVPQQARPPIGKTPKVGIFVCTYDEGLHVLEATLVGCDRITYPHTTYVLDDGRRREVRQLADTMGAAYITRPTNEHAKAGNINHALAITGDDLILMLDADHVPQPDILDATVGYFDDEQMALVQTPHDFGNHDSFQHFSTGRHDQSMFFEVIMPGKDRHNAAYWCGSAAIISRRALEDIGGIAIETVAEDFHTTIRLHRHGWRTKYHHETLVQGLAPHDLASFLLQRDRWARGNLAVFRTAENPLTTSGLTPKQRASYLSSLFGYFVPIQRLVMLAVLVTMLVGGITPMSAPAWQFAALWLPWISLEMTAGMLLSRGQVNPWDGSYTILLTTEIFTRAVFVLLRPFRLSFRVTPKDGIDEGGWGAARQLRLVLAVAGLLITSVLLRVLAIAGALTLPHLGSLAIWLGISFAAWELIIVGSALWRVTRRHQVRRQYRVPVAIAGLIDKALVRIVDLTPDGAALISSSPMGRDEETSLRMDLPTIDGGTQTVRGQFIVHSCRTDGDLGWRIGGSLVARSSADREALIEHCHVVGGRSRLIEEGRLKPEPPIIYGVDDHFAHGRAGGKVS